MEELDIVLPIILVLIAFLLKLVVDKDVKIADAIQASIELPIDLMFLAITFSVAATLSSVHAQEKGLLYSFVGIVIAILVVFISKKNIKYFTSNKKSKWVILLLLNLIISIYGVKFSVDLLTSIKSEQINTVCKSTQGQTNNNLE